MDHVENMCFPKPREYIHKLVRLSLYIYIYILDNQLLSVPLALPLGQLPATHGTQATVEKPRNKKGGRIDDLAGSWPPGVLNSLAGKGVPGASEINCLSVWT